MLLPRFHTLPQHTMVYHIFIKRLLADSQGKGLKRLKCYMVDTRHNYQLILQFLSHTGY